MTISIHMGRIGAWLAVGGGAAWTGLSLLNLIFEGNSLLLAPLKVLGLLGICLALTIAGKALKPDLDYWPAWGLGAGIGIAFALLWSLYAILTTNVRDGGTDSSPLQIFIAYAVPGIPALLVGVTALSRARGVQDLVSRTR